MYRVIALSFILLSAWELHGAQAILQMGTSRGPHYIGEGAVIQFDIEGLKGKSDPKVEYESITPGLNARLVSVSPQVSEMVTNINGNVTRIRSVKYRITYQLTADEPGRYSIGPFTISQDGTELNGQAVSFTFQDVETDPDMKIVLKLPEEPIYPGQRVNVGVEWWYVRDQAEDVFPPRISSLLFDQFQFIDQPAKRNQQLVPIETAEGTVKLAAQLREETVDNQTFLVVSAQRTMVVTRPGEYELPPITASIRKVTKWARRRELFGRIRNVPVEDKPMRAVGEPKTLVVKPLPTTGRPESFAGAVGEGFSVDVTANRTVVRAGDPIKLNITLRGSGNLENASLPPLSADGGMDPDLFRLPEGDTPGEFDGEKKEFQVSVRVNQEGVREIPALAYSWFDPESETYKTSRSKPIALSVGEAKIVTDRDVFSAVEPRGSTPIVPSDTNSAGSQPPVSEDSFVGADLSIVSDESLLRASHVRTAAWLQTSFYVVGLLAVAVAIWDRRRNDVDPALADRRRVLRQQRQAIVAASSQPRRESARAVADALRTLIAELPDSSRDATEKLIAQCESIAYEPEAKAGDRLDASLLAAATSAADQYIKDAE